MCMSLFFFSVTVPAPSFPLPGLGSVAMDGMYQSPKEKRKKESYAAREGYVPVNGLAAFYWAVPRCSVIVVRRSFVTCDVGIFQK
ncbi:hypothetical protein QBC32DRAFT_342718 [Pseudoneurospora amorphoporcata]|uniref:Secreted protein n=1 Tax=Pseudoneurospora amorphoporcata TaxID=241081 RepID=A0AAN6NXH3_9PEZI|nr:hypothetical protein QBC32DRAFT_342718 [Pseudoneurospora amorphoporcata]